MTGIFLIAVAGVFLAVCIITLRKLGGGPVNILIKGVVGSIGAFIVLWLLWMAYMVF